MGKVSVWLFIFITAGCHFSIAQKDSLYTDTVIIVKDPHIINKQIYTYNLSSEKPIKTYNSVEIFTSLGSSLKTLTRDQSFSPGTFINYGLLFSRNFGPFEAGIGVGALYGNFSHTVKKRNYFCPFGIAPILI